MFGLDGSPPLFDRIFRQASIAWVRRGYINQPVSASQGKDDRFLKQLYAAVPKESRVEAPKEEFKFPAQPPVEKKTETPIMTRPVNIYFNTGSAALDPNAKQLLDGVALTAQTYSNAYLRVEGNTDSVGNRQRNVILSQKRAQAVSNYLVARYGFNRARFIAKGNGPDRPVASNATPEGKSKNRRTDVMVIPK
jgi:outer membrane protein OmpA-like peptidoglycan-associated protein